jgi:hypothetical protein
MGRNVDILQRLSNPRENPLHERRQNLNFHDARSGFRVPLSPWFWIDT